MDRITLPPGAEEELQAFRAQHEGAGAVMPVLLDRHGRYWRTGRRYDQSSEATGAWPFRLNDELPLWCHRGNVPAPDTAWQVPTAFAVDTLGAFESPRPPAPSVALPDAAIVWVDNQAPRPDEDSGSVIALALLRIAVELCFLAVFVPAFASSTAPRSRRLG